MYFTNDNASQMTNEEVYIIFFQCANTSYNNHYTELVCTILGI